MRGSVDDEAWVLSTDEGRSLLAEATGVAAPGPVHLMRWRKTAEPGRVAAAVRLADGQRRGASKFARADRMWFEPTGLEQATAEAVARHKAARFAGRAGRVIDLCCGVGGDTIALAATGAGVLAVDLDQGMTRRALWNAGVYGVADRVAAVRARAEAFELPRGAWVHVDPDRRAPGRRRALDVADYRPGLGFLRSLTRAAEGGAIKLGPASDFAAHFERFEVELISLWGECKEATVWFAAAATCRRRATRLPEGASWTDRDGPGRAFAEAGPVDRYVFDPDPALTRSGLLDAFAVAHGLLRIADGIDYLTGPTRIVSPFLDAFEVDATLPLDLKRVRREVAARGFGPLEVRTRGVDLTPEAVRAAVKPGVGAPGTLILAGGQGPARAVLARRVGPAAPPG